MRLPLVDGQGNFGSIDGDPPAAMRYTECRWQKVAQALLETSTRTRSTSRRTTTTPRRNRPCCRRGFPILLVNGAGGIAVGMATNIPPHNLGEVIDACNCGDRQPGDQLRGAAWRSCRGRISRPAASFWAGPVSARQDRPRLDHVMRGKVDIEEVRKDREAIIVTRFPTR
jgi:DNA gyrase subunit A